MFCCSPKKKCQEEKKGCPAVLCWMLGILAVAGAACAFFTMTRPGKQMWKKLKKTGEDCIDACENAGRKIANAVTDEE